MSVTVSTVDPRVADDLVRRHHDPRVRLIVFGRGFTSIVATTSESATREAIAHADPHATVLRLSNPRHSR